MEDTILKILLNDCVSVWASQTTNLVETARQMHGTYPVATAALGRTLTAAMMMGGRLKSAKNRLTVSINGGGPAGTVLATANGAFEVKGYIANPYVNLPARADGKLDVGGAVGKSGFVTVVKDIGLKEPYVGKTPLVSGEIAEDMAQYMLMSEQNPGIVYLSVWVDTDCTVLRSGGLIITPMPGADEQTVEEIESRIEDIGNFGVMLFGMSAEGAVKKIFHGMDIKILETGTPKYVCDCSVERIKGVIVSLGKQEIEDMINEDGKAEITCRFCNKKYVFNADELRQLLKDALERE